MLTIHEFIAYMKTKFPAIVFFNSTIDSSQTKCVGTYARTSGRVQAIGSPGSYDILPISMVIHWTEDAGQCEDMANTVYTQLSTIIKELTPAGIMISYVQLQDSAPVWVGRDDKNIAEKVIRANIIYERGA